VTQALRSDICRTETASLKFERRKICIPQRVSVVVSFFSTTLLIFKPLAVVGRCFIHRSGGCPHGLQPAAPGIPDHHGGTILDGAQHGLWSVRRHQRYTKSRSVGCYNAEDSGPERGCHKDAYSGRPPQGALAPPQRLDTLQQRQPSFLNISQEHSPCWCTSPMVSRGGSRQKEASSADIVAACMSVQERRRGRDHRAADNLVVLRITTSPSRGGGSGGPR